MNKRPQQSGNGMFVQVQTSVEIQSSVSISYRCSEKEYERLFIREPEVKARAGKMAYVRPEYHERIMRITRVIGQDTPFALRLHRPCAHATLQPMRRGDKKPLRKKL